MSPFEPYFRDIDPVYAIALVLLAGAASLVVLHRFGPFFVIRKGQCARGLATAALLATVFALVVVGADLTFRNVPARNSNRRGWILQGEYIQKGATTGGSYQKQQNGWYGSFQYRLSQLWWTGVRIEQARDSFTDFLVDGAGDPVAGKITRGSVNVAWAPSEFSFVRLEYSHAVAKAAGGLEPDDDRILLEMSYTIGFHPAHAY